MYELINENDPLLREIMPLVTSFDDELADVAKRMIVTMIERRGFGLAAPQVGLALRMFVMNSKGKIISCVNPEIIETDDEVVCEEEGCLSFPDLTLKVTRAEKITGYYVTAEGELITETLEGIDARCFQHELDHLNGITFDKRVSKLVLSMARKKRLKQRGK